MIGIVLWWFACAARARFASHGVLKLWLWLCQEVARWITRAKRAWTTLTLRLDGWWTTKKPLPTTRPQGCPHPARVTHRTVLSATWGAGSFKGSFLFFRSKSTRPAAEEGPEPGPRAEGRSPVAGDQSALAEGRRSRPFAVRRSDRNRHLGVPLDRALSGPVGMPAHSFQLLLTQIEKEELRKPRGSYTVLAGSRSRLAGSRSRLARTHS